MEVGSVEILGLQILRNSKVKMSVLKLKWDAVEINSFAAWWPKS